MDFQTLKKRAAEKLNLLDSNGDIQTGKDIAEAGLGRAINDGYLEDAYPLLQSQYPQYFEQRALVTNYSVTGTVDASSTGTTLVAESSIFTESMVGQYVENTTDSESAKITAYTSATTVTVNTTIGDTWDGDSIRVIERDFAFGGDSTDLYAPRTVMVRYTSTGTRIPATLRERNDLFQSGFEECSQADPQCVIGTVDVSGTPTTMISIYPLMKTSDSKAVEIYYLEKPAELSGNTDTPRLPVAHHEFLLWKGVEYGAIQRRDFKLANEAAAKFEKGKREMISNFRLTSFNGPKSIEVPRRVGLMQGRVI